MPHCSALQRSGLLVFAGQFVLVIGQLSCSQHLVLNEVSPKNYLRSWTVFGSFAVLIACVRSCAISHFPCEIFCPNFLLHDSVTCQGLPCAFLHVKSSLTVFLNFRCNRYIILILDHCCWYLRHLPLLASWRLPMARMHRPEALAILTENHMCSGFNAWKINDKSAIAVLVFQWIGLPHSLWIRFVP